MKDKACLFARKNAVSIGLILIVSIGIFLRFYHFSDWLHFELDQSRDARLVDMAVEEGIENLPLLGPKAAGTFLRLGPAFYYFKYLSALVFGDTPSGMAVIIAIFGVLAIPIFFLFIRRCFNKKISLALAFLFSVSLFLVFYSRFSWNPNPLPLFSLLAFYALLRLCDLEEPNRGRWLLVFAFSLAIATQLHFLAFVAVPAISFVFIVIKRPRIKLIYWIWAFLIVLFLYSPAVINDIQTGGDNIGQFLKVAKGKSDKGDHNIIEKAIKSYNESSLGYAAILFGTEKRDLPRIIFKRDQISYICDENCENEVRTGILCFMFFTFGAFLLFWNLKGEKNQTKKDFLLLVAIWFLFSLALFTLIAYDISPRFFLLASAIPFIFLGLAYKFLKNIIKQKKFLLAVVMILTIAISGFNIWKIKQRFWQLENAPYKVFKIETDKILKEKTRVTLAQQYKIMDDILSVQKSNDYPVYLNSDPEYRRSFLYHLDKHNIARDDFRNATASGKVYEQGNYFLIYPTLSNYKKDLDKYALNFELASQKEFGTLTLFRLEPKRESINAVRQVFDQEEKVRTDSGVPARYRWEEIFNDSDDEEKQ